ncbi:hypothetical protein D9M71_726750 [compost metagenome]
MPFVLAVSAKLKQMAFALAPASLTENSQFLRPITFGRIAFSAGLLSISIRPSNRKAFNPCIRFNVYSAALAKAFFPKKGDSSTHFKNFSTIGFEYFCRDFRRLPGGRCLN